MWREKSIVGGRVRESDESGAGSDVACEEEECMSGVGIREKRTCPNCEHRR